MMKERVKAELTVTKIGAIFGSEEVSYYFEDTNGYKYVWRTRSEKAWEELKEENTYMCTFNRYHFDNTDNKDMLHEIDNVRF